MRVRIFASGHFFAVKDDRGFGGSLKASLS